MVEEGHLPATQYNLESFDQQPLSPPERYPLPDAVGSAFPFNYQSLSVEEKKEFLVITRNSIDLLSSILNSETEPKPLKVFLSSFLSYFNKNGVKIGAQLSKRTF